ncbi:uncharacterized protein K02A2.6-like [Corticium candelabrum]|uniref:uncharacterized protein K02A2.6-like n=1 Tax=Corticium candelabrum TaxID=121492 RepID=UPI002E2705CA|nr:uncharacterized protein K02A2.6-like [Corticium candelabrum]
MARLHSSDRRQAGRETCRNIDNLGNAQEDKGDTHRISRDIATEKWTHLQGNHEDTDQSSNDTSNDLILLEFKAVFDGLSCLPGHYSIRLDDNAVPVIYAPRRAPVALRDAIRDELDRMTEEGIIEPVTEPTPWVSSMVNVRKQNNKVWTCIDPQDLSKSIRLANAKVFLVWAARASFWQIKLDERSSLLTTFNTPFGQYRWRRISFCISSASEVWQQRMQEVVEGLSGVEVIADDFLVIGRGNTQEEAIATCDHDKKLREFLKRALERNLKLSLETTKLRLTEVLYMGHKITSKGLGAHPDKVKAIREMPTPTDVKAL